MCLTVPRLFTIAQLSKESKKGTCLLQIGFSSRLTVGVAPPGRLSIGRPAEFCDPGHKTTCLGSLRVPKRENGSDLRKKARLQVGTFPHDLRSHDDGPALSVRNLVASDFNFIVGTLAGAWLR
jgi:hypothetical protein